MKKLSLILSVFAAVITLSCSKESAPSVVGKWHFYSSGAKGTGSTIVWEANVDSPCEAQSFTQLNEDGSVYEENYFINIMTNACELQVNSQSLYTYTWRRDGDDFIWTEINHSTNPATQDESKTHIVSLSETELIIQQYSSDGTTLIDDYAKLIRK
jgi:PBP1b-binding outer membrane lipoprotein LpoB